MHLCVVFLKKSVICDVFDSFQHFVEIVRYLINTVHWLSLEAWRRTTPIFYTATNTMTDLVNTQHVGNRQQDAMLSSQVLCTWCTQSIVLTVKGGWALTRWYFKTMFCVFLVKKHAAFKWKDAISGFPVSPGSARALVRWGGKVKYILIAYFLSNIFAKIVAIEPCM